MNNQILIIKLGALGDFIQALGSIYAIRNHHKNQQLTLLTSTSFEAIARKSKIFENIWIDHRPSKINFPGWLSMRKKLRSGCFTRIYDLQTSQRSSLYFHFLWPGPYPEWSGIARGCSHPHRNNDRNQMHTIDRQAQQLHFAGIKAIPTPDLSWIKADISKFNLPDTFALLAPGGAIHRPQKRWSPNNFGILAAHLNNRGIRSVIIGDNKEIDLANGILKHAPHAINLIGNTTLLEVLTIGKKATLAIGNDTGPMHICAIANCHSFVIFSENSNSKLCAPRGRFVTILEEKVLKNLTSHKVWKVVETEIQKHGL